MDSHLTEACANSKLVTDRQTSVIFCEHDMKIATFGTVTSLIGLSIPISWHVVMSCVGHLFIAILIKLPGTYMHLPVLSVYLSSVRVLTLNTTEFYVHSD